MDIQKCHIWLKLTIPLCVRLTITNASDTFHHTKSPLIYWKTIRMLFDGRVVDLLRMYACNIVHIKCKGERKIAFFCSIVKTLHFYCCWKWKRPWTWLFEYWPQISPAWSNVVRISFSPFWAIKEVTRESNKIKTSYKKKNQTIKSCLKKKSLNEFTSEIVRFIFSEIFL